jgi:DNA-binding MarR family transcriptional regulator
MSERGDDRGMSGEELTGAAAELAAAFKATLRGAMRMRGRDTHLGGSELSYAQLELLLQLYERGELPAGELATAADLTPATVTQMLDHLAAAGHVERLRSGSDRRVVVSRLTPDGRRLLVSKRRAWQRRWAEALRGVSERDLRAAARVLMRLQALYGDSEEYTREER